MPRDCHRFHCLAMCAWLCYGGSVMGQVTWRHFAIITRVRKRPTAANLSVNDRVSPSYHAVTHTAEAFFRHSDDGDRRSTLISVASKQEVLRQFQGRNVDGKTCSMSQIKGPTRMYSAQFGFRLLACLFCARQRLCGLGTWMPYRHGPASLHSLHFASRSNQYLACYIIRASDP